MKTLGIDLASQPDKSAACLIEWRADVAEVLLIKIPLADDDALALARGLDLLGEQGAGDAVGIDAPFGWPQPFIELIGRNPIGVRRMMPWGRELARTLCYRLTDQRVRESLRLVPLAVSADRIAFPAMRCTGLLDDLGVTDRSGRDGVFEVYPAAALKAWGLPHQGFKGKDPIKRNALAELFALVSEQCPWLRFADEEHRSLCERSDDGFDALIASLATRAAALGRTDRPRDAHEEALAQIEGWIAFPRTGCLIGDLNVGEASRP